MRKERIEAAEAVVLVDVLVVEAVVLLEMALANLRQPRRSTMSEAITVARW